MKIVVQFILLYVFPRQRPYHVERTSSRPITEVKQHWARSVLRWVTAWEHRVPLATFLHQFINIVYILYLTALDLKLYLFVMDITISAAVCPYLNYLI